MTKQPFAPEALKQLVLGQLGRQNLASDFAVEQTSDGVTATPKDTTRLDTDMARTCFAHLLKLFNFNKDGNVVTLHFTEPGSVSVTRILDLLRSQAYDQVVKAEKNGEPIAWHLTVT
jgi:hypothetical protein